MAWTEVPSQDVGTGENELYAVTVISPGDIWAVGAYMGTGRYLTLTEHWNGAQWSIVPSPNSSHGYNNFLRGVTAAASNDVWAVGDYTERSLLYQPPYAHAALGWYSVERRT